MGIYYLWARVVSFGISTTRREGIPGLKPGISFTALGGADSCWPRRNSPPVSVETSQLVRGTGLLDIRKPIATDMTEAGQESHDQMVKRQIIHMKPPFLKCLILSPR